MTEQVGFTAPNSNSCISAIYLSIYQSQVPSALDRLAVMSRWAGDEWQAPPTGRDCGDQEWSSSKF